MFSRSFFARPERLSAAELATMFHIYFLGSSEGLVFDVAESNFDSALWNPLREYLIERGVQIQTGVSAESISVGGAKALQVHGTDGTTIDADGVVLATDLAGLQQIVDGLTRPRRRRVAGPGGGLAHRAAVRGAAAVAGPSGRRRTGRRSWAPAASSPSTTSAWSATTNARPRSGLARTAVRWSSCTPTRWSTRRRSTGLRERMLGRLHQLYPETAAANIVGETLLLRDDCPLFAPGAYAAADPRSTPRCPA